MNSIVAVRIGLCIVLALSTLATRTAGFTCTPDEMWVNYRLPTSPVVFNGTDTAPDTTDPTASRCFISAIVVTCQGPIDAASAKLADGDLGPVDLDVSAVHAWNKNFSIDFELRSTNTPSVTVTAVNLFFYNIPSMGVGLPPDIELFYGNNVAQDYTRITNFTILNNQDLNQEDNQRRNVTLVVTDSNVPIYGFFRVQFGFSESHPIGWMLLSEIQLCTGTPPVNVPTFDAPSLANDSNITIPLGPMDNVVSSYTLICSVADEGRFQWVWTFPSNDVQYQQLDVDGTRTSIVELSQISAVNGYDGDYQCQAMYHFDALPSNPDLSIAPRVFTLDLRSDFSANATMIEFSNEDTFITLACEISGYVQRQDVSIMWQFDNNVISTEFPYEITIEEGDNVIQDGSTRPSLRSVLKINVTSSVTVEGGYICQATQGDIVQINVFRSSTNGGGGDATTPPSTPSSPSSSQETQSTGAPPSSISLNIIIGAAVGGAVVLVLIIMIIVIFILCCCRRRMTNYPMKSFDNKDSFGVSEPFYQEVSKPLPPPLPDRFPYPPGSNGAYAMIDHNGESNGHIELVTMGNQRSSVCSAPDPSNPTPMRLVKNQPDFLQNNPLYASADHLDRDRSPPDFQPNNMRMGSNPSSDSVHNSTLNIYAQPSRVVPPVPRRPSTPTLLGKPIYSEANITPAVFRQNRQPSPLENELHPYASIYDDPRPLIQSEGPLEVTAQSIREKRSLGLGQFGQVILAETVNLSLKDLKLSETNDDKSITVLVAIKKLKLNADIHIKEAFEKEIKFMGRLKHENVVRLLGICSQGDIFMIMEYMENGDLNQYLRRHDIAPLDSPPGENQLRPSQLLFMALQIASGMKYLASLHFIHRDLATRNCLVGKNNEVKIADFGMSRSLYSSYYYRIRGRAMLPIRWMANECFYGKFSEKTDIWAFGVTMWEIFTFAKQQPYEELTDQELIDDAIKGPDRQILSRPEHCPPEVYDEVMLKCWIDDVDERAKFEDLHSSLAAINDYSDIP